MEDVTEKNILTNGVDNHESDGNTSFLRAARNGQLEKVLEHLKTNIDINTSNANGLNALHLASKDGHVEIVEELLKRGAIVDAATKKGNTALHIASLAGQEEVVKLLVHHGASVNVQSQNGFTPLYMAAQENHDNVVKFLLANGANQSLSTEDGFTPLAVAMQQGHDKVVTVLLENDTRGKVRLPALHIAAKKDDVRAAKLLLENDHNPDVTSKSGFTPLHIASHYGNQSIANLLIQKGADVNYSAKHNITPLHVAAKWGKNNMVAVLLEQGAHIEAKTRDGLTPLHCAARSGHEQVVDMLLEKSAPISSKTKNGLAPLHMAAQGDHVDAARILLYHRAPVDEVTVDYLTALHVAAHCGHVRVAKLLLDRQADANARALNGFTPLHIACKKNRIKVVELLLKHGACIGATTESGLTPLHVASFMGCMNIVIYLLQHDASPDIPTVRGETPLHLAARANQTDIIRILLRNGAQVDARAREQQTPLHIASRLGNVDIVMLLLQHGAKLDNSTKDMYTALHIAAKEGQDEVASVLIENGACLNATTKKGFTPLHLAAKYGHLKVAKLLVQKEAPVDAQGKNGVTPLHVASHYDNQNVALLLLDKGASPHANAKNGHTPLHIAARKNQMDIAHTLLEYGAQPDAESKAGFTPLHLSAQEGHTDISALLLEHKATASHQSKNGLTPMHLCAQENKVGVADILHKNGAEIDVSTKGGYTPLHIACHYGQADMVKFLLSKGADVKTTTSIGYTPLHQAAQQGHANIVNIMLENSAQPNAVTNNGQTPLHIAQKLGYITVIDTLKEVTESTQAPLSAEEKYRVVAPEAMQETYLSDSEEEGEDTLLGDQTYRYLTADEMKSLGDDSLPIDVTRDERIDSNRMVGSDDLNAFPPRHIEDSISPEHIHPNYVEYIKKPSDNIDIYKHPLNIGFLVSFLVDARGGAMRGCRHSGVRVIVPPRCAHSPTRITCRYVRPQRTPHPPPLMEGEALASRVLELGPVGATFLGPVIIEVPHFAALRGKEREIVVLRSDNGESWKEHTVEATEDVLNEILRDSFDAEDLNQLEDASLGRITRIITQDFPQYFAVISRVKQEVHAIGPEGGMVSSTVVPQVQAVFPQGALTKKIKVGLQAQPIDPELTAKMLGHGVAVSPVVTVEPRRRKFHKAITLSMPAPRAHSQGMINQYSGSAPTLRLLCSITGGTSRAQWEDVTGSTPLTFVNDCVSFTTTVSARFWLMDCRNIGDATKMATELYREAIHVPFIAKFVVFAKRIDPLEARLRVFCMTDDKEEKTLEYQEQFTEIAKSRDVEVSEGKSQYIEFAGNLVPVTKSGDQLQFSFRAFKENRLPFSVRVKDQHAEAVSRCLFMREPKVHKGEPPQQPICILNILLPDDIVSDTISLTDSDSIRRKYFATENFDYYRQDPRLADISNLLGDDWVQLANQLGLTSSEINVIKSEYPDSVAKQAQSMLRMWLSQSGNRTQANTLDNALRRIGRDDIVKQCLNEDNRSQQILRIKPEEKGKQRLKEEISEQDFLNREDYYLETEKGFKTKSDTFDKYSAEEKIIEPSDEEDDFSKTVPERREQIVKRLSNERTIPASSQRVEIVQEISSIKRKSLVEDKIAEVQQKVNIEPMKSVTVKSKISQEKALPEVTEMKTKTPHEDDLETVPKAQDTEETSRTNVSNLETHVDSDRRDSILLEEVTHRLESKRPTSNLNADEDPKSPKFSKTPPPSPADFIMREKEASAAQEWCATKTEEYKGTSRETQGKATSPQYLDKLEEKLDKSVDTCVVRFPNTKTTEICDFKRILNDTNAFLKCESEAEPYDVWTEIIFNDLKSEIESPPREIPKNKTMKKGIMKTLKSFITKSTESLDSELDTSSTKTGIIEKRSKTVLDVATAQPKSIYEGGSDNDRELIEDKKCKKSIKSVENIRNNNGESIIQADVILSVPELEFVDNQTATTEEYITSQLKAKKQIDINVIGKPTDYLEIHNLNEPLTTKTIISDNENKIRISDPVPDQTDESNSSTFLSMLKRSSKTKNDSEVSTNIKKKSKENIEETFYQSETKKPGFWSFFTKKSKKSIIDEDETNLVPDEILEIYEKLKVTESFLQWEKDNYDYIPLPNKDESQENEPMVQNEKMLQYNKAEKIDIPKSFLSKLKPKDCSPTDMERSYIKFDEDDLSYEPLNTVVHEKQKKVTFEESTYKDILPLGNADEKQLPQRLICRLKESKELSVEADNVDYPTLLLPVNEVDLRKKATDEEITEKKVEKGLYENEDLQVSENYKITKFDPILLTDGFLNAEKFLHDVKQEKPITFTNETVMLEEKLSANEISKFRTIPEKSGNYLALDERKTSRNKKNKFGEIRQTSTEIFDSDVRTETDQLKTLVLEGNDNKSLNIFEERQKCSTIDKKINGFQDINDSCINESNITDAEIRFMTDAFLKRETIQYHDNNNINLTTDVSSNDINSCQHDKESKNKRFFSLFGRKKKSSDKSSKETGKENDRSAESYLEIQPEPNKEPEQQESLIVSPIIESEQNLATQERNMSEEGNSKRKGIFKVFDEKENSLDSQSYSKSKAGMLDNDARRPTSNVIELTNEFLRNENIISNHCCYPPYEMKKKEDNTEEVVTYKEQETNYVSKAPVVLKILREKSEHNNESLGVKVLPTATKTEILIRNNFPTEKFDSKLGNISSVIENVINPTVENSIQSTNNFLHVEKGLYNIETNPNERYSTDNFPCEKYGRKQQNPKNSTNNDDHNREDFSGIFNNTGEGENIMKVIPTEEEKNFSMEKMSLQQNPENEGTKSITKSEILIISSQDVIHSTRDFLTMENKIYHDVKQNMQKTYQDEDGNGLEFGKQISQETKLPDTKSRRFLNIFKRKSDSKLDRLENEAKKIDGTDVISSEIFLKMERTLYEESPYGGEPKTGQILCEKLNNTTLENEASRTVVKDTKAKGIFKIFSKKSEEKIKSKVEGSAEIRDAKGEAVEDENKIPSKTIGRNFQTDKELPSSPDNLVIFEEYFSSTNYQKILETTDIFLKTEKKLYYDYERNNFGSGPANQTGDGNIVLEAPEVVIRQRVSPEKIARRKNIFRIFHRKSEEKENLSKGEVKESKSEEKSKKDEDDKHCKNVDRYNIFGKKSKPLNKTNARDVEIEQKKLIGMTKEFLHKETKMYYDERFTESIYHDFQIDQTHSSIIGCKESEEQNRRYEEQYEPSNERKKPTYEENTLKKDTLSKSKEKSEQPGARREVFEKLIIVPIQSDTPKTELYDYPNSEHLSSKIVHSFEHTGSISGITLRQNQSTDLNVERIFVENTGKRDSELEMRKKLLTNNDNKKIIQEHEIKNKKIAEEFNTDTERNREYSLHITDLQGKYIQCLPEFSREEKKISLSQIERNIASDALKQYSPVDNTRVNSSSEIEVNDQKFRTVKQESLGNKLKSKSIPTDFVEKDRREGILKFFSRRSGSKEKKDVLAETLQIEDQELTSRNFQACKLFLENEVKMYLGVNPPLESKPHMGTSSELLCGEKSALDLQPTTKKPTKKSSFFTFLKKKSKHDNENIEKESEKNECSPPMIDSASFLREEVTNYEDIFPSKTIPIEQKIKEITNSGSSISTEDKNLEGDKEYTAFDFIKEEVNNFENSTLRSTDTIDSSFRVETEVEQIDGNNPKEIIRKKIIISEKLIERPGKTNLNIETTNKILETLMDINKSFKEQKVVNQQCSELAPMGTSNIVDVKFNNNSLLSGTLPTNSEYTNTRASLLKSRSEEEVESVEVEFVQKIRDLELAKGDVIEDVSPFEKKIEIFSKDTVEKITDLDESLPNEFEDLESSTSITNLEIKPIAYIFNEAFEEPMKRTQNNIRVKELRLLDNFNNTGSDRKCAVTKLSEKETQAPEVPESIQVTESFVKELEIQYHPDQTQPSKNKHIASFPSGDTKRKDLNNMIETSIQNKYPNSPSAPSHELIVKIDIQNVTHSYNLSEIDQNSYKADNLIDCTQVESSNHNSSIREVKCDDCSKRKPLFRIESDDDDFIASTKAREIKEENFEISDLSPDRERREIDPILEDTFGVDSKSDVQIIEDKLRDLGKALDALERLSEIKSDSKDELNEKKLRRVERKFERMTSEALEPTTDNNQGLKTYNSAENERYQQLVSQLSTDEVISFQNEYNNLWDEYTFSKSEEWDSKTPESQADVVELPQGDAPTQPSDSPDMSTFREQTPDSATEKQGQVRPQTIDQQQLSEEMKELLEEMEKSSKQ